MYNLVLFHPDDGSVESWTAGGNVDETRRGPDNPEPRWGRSSHFWGELLKMSGQSAKDAWNDSAEHEIPSDG